MFIHDYLIYLFTDWLCELTLILWLWLWLKDQNINPLWTDFICSKFWLSRLVHFFRDVQFVHHSSSSFSSSPSVITSAVCSENSEIIYSTGNGRDWLVPCRKCTSRNVELNDNFFVRSIFVKLSQFFVFKVTLLCFLFVVIMDTQAIFFHALIFKTTKFKNTKKT